jgi:hypothetical protein
MAIQTEKDGTIIINGFDQGISPSPHKGIANIQGANLSTEMGEVMASFNRVQQNQASVASGTLTSLGTYYLSSSIPLQAGTWITISNSTITSLAAGTYYVSLHNTSGYQLSNYYDPIASNTISHGTTGTATFATAYNMGKPIASATETYSDGTNTQYRYYLLDSNALVWVYDTYVYASTLFIGGIGETWFLPDYSTTYYQNYSNVLPTGIAVLNGWLLVFGWHEVYAKSTVNLGNTIANTSTYNYLVVGNSATTTAATTASISSGATTATLASGGWVQPTGLYQVTFSSGDVRQVLLTQFATGISWTPGLTGNATSTLTITGNANYDALTMNSGLNSNTPHFAFVGHQGRCYYTDGNQIGGIFPNSALPSTGALNVQSFCSYTASTTQGTVSAVIAGTLPTNGYATDSGSFLRIPVVFFTTPAGTQPTNLASGVVYWIAINPQTGLFQVYLTQTGGTAINIATGATGLQYFNTFYPISGFATYAGVNPTGTTQYATPALFLPNFETATTIGEIGNLAIIGCQSNALYPWNQYDIIPSTYLALPENGTVCMTNVNNMMYVFAGNKGNIYITDGSVVSHVYSVPDYCAGVPGTPSSYIEPYFTWQAAMYLRGRVYFSILDQTSTKAGNCGGIWSFVPTQNYFIQQDVSIALTLENQNSYGSYNGAASVLIPFQNQQAIAPQYFSGWFSSITGATYGIDFTGTTPSVLVVESDSISMGSMLQKLTNERVEYKLSAPLDSGGSVVIKYRQNATDAWSPFINTLQTDTPLSGYYQVSFEKSQWLQLQITLTSNGTSTSSFCRLQELRIV